MAVVGAIWNGPYNASIRVGNLFDVYHHKRFLSQRLFKTLSFRYKCDIIFYS
jgi:hypothetical protein